ncbi:hypothetical protein NLM31_29045 [Bradyrhizobium sp. CCGUVB4N]|uniref:hypothetical protein n=1 Tax=Bradyrhizobium sp. CCGUVB4N TaxID=2949631 RepID=UPI0020B38A15|nr:hypothetical protein [Bradyrhizobium sp. CCGUVB4N]MCP3384424.1 hypothetical protein [Bradyrhizobium sp. CCGUVB4N]
MASSSRKDIVLEHPNGLDSVGEAIAHHGRPVTTSHDRQNGYSGLIRMADRGAQKSHYPRPAISNSFSQSRGIRQTTAVLP